MTYPGLARARVWVQTFHPSPRTGLLIAFVFGFLVRLLPEVLSSPHPIGFDTIYYAWRIKEGIIWTHWSSIFSSWLLYALLIPAHEVLKVEPFALLKLAMPLLFGLNACGVHYLAVKGFHWSVRKGLFAAGLYSFQLGALGISWHFYRNMLGLGLLLFAIPWILVERVTAKGLAAFSILSLFAVFSHEYASVLLMLAVVGVVVSKTLSGKRIEAAKVVGAVVPAAIVFAASVFVRISPVYTVAQPSILMAYHPSGHYSGPFFFITDYLTVSDTIQHYPSYVDLAASVISLSAILYVAILPLALVGFFRNRVLDAWMILLCVGAFGCLFLPFFALDYWNRWLLLLVLPLTFFGANGYVRVLQSAQPVTVSLGRVGTLRISKRAAKGLLLISITSGFVFMTSPMFFEKGGVYGLPTTVVYLPSTMLCNAVPLTDVDSTVEALQWATTMMDDTSCLLAHDAFFNWAKFSLDEQYTIVFFKNDVYAAIDLAAAHEFRRCWLVWWNEDIGWYGFHVPESFMEIYHVGRVSVFEYVVI